MEEHRVHARRNRRNSGSVSGSQTATKPGKWILLVCISFGLLCIIQASLNVYLRLFLQDRRQDLSKQKDELQKSHSSFKECQQSLSSLRNELEKHQSLLETRAHEITEEINKQKRRLQVIDNYASEGWVYFQGSVYLGSITEQSWEQSRQYCQERGADLIIIKSDQEQTFASTFTGHRWIGLTATQSEPRQWRWVDGSQLNTRFWASGEPNNKYNEYCTETKTKNTGKGWNDLKCSEKRPCICQKRPTF
ncbi:CD209 antigen-like protein C isoform X1 [Boleophthalmus pectinirostris]|uniref:CD209 antigen-like protein C isoform X1 n=1 Tax=Boleophthalmus pectinirostris TaxID=150288 RepID=UPI00242FA42D|nr:CD209 antigen-like protein C isoform X1 [Boleophthalmus pectinirostris]